MSTTNQCKLCLWLGRRGVQWNFIATTAWDVHLQPVQIVPMAWVLPAWLIRIDHHESASCSWFLHGRNENHGLLLNLLQKEFFSDAKGIKADPIHHLGLADVWQQALVDQV